MPDKLHRLFAHIRERVVSVVIAVRSRKDYDSKLHASAAPRGIWGISILAQRRNQVGSVGSRPRLRKGAALLRTSLPPSQTPATIRFSSARYSADVLSLNTSRNPNASSTPNS